MKTKRRRVALSIQITIFVVCLAVAVMLIGCQPENEILDCESTVEQTDDGAYIVATMTLSQNTVEDVAIELDVGGSFKKEIPITMDDYVAGEGNTYTFEKRLKVAQVITGDYVITFKTATDSRETSFSIDETHIDGSEAMPSGTPSPRPVRKSGWTKFWEYVGKNADRLLRYFLEHMRNTGIAVGSAVAIGVPLGILITRFRKAAGFVLGFANVFQTIPSLAWFGLLISIMGIGMLPAVFVLFLFALLPIIKNTYIGISGVDRGVIEAATGMGMTNLQILGRIEIPLALPVIMGGIRIATVVNIGSATIAAYIGGGGLGNFIFSGIAMVRYEAIMLGALAASILALVVDFLLGRLEKGLTSKGVSRTKRNEREGAI